MFHYAIIKQGINLSPDVTSTVKEREIEGNVGLQRREKSVEHQIIKVLSGGVLPCLPYFPQREQLTETNPHLSTQIIYVKGNF